jgi:hypothetical protein
MREKMTGFNSTKFINDGLVGRFKLDGFSPKGKPMNEEKIIQKQMQKKRTKPSCADKPLNVRISPC